MYNHWSSIAHSFLPEVLELADDRLVVEQDAATLQNRNAGRFVLALIGTKAQSECDVIINAASQQIAIAHLLIHRVGQSAAKEATGQRDNGQADCERLITGVAAAEWKWIEHHIGAGQ